MSNQTGGTARVVATAENMPVVLRRLREARGLSQRELARKAGMTASVVCRLENLSYRGHSLDTLRRLGAVLGVAVAVQFAPAEVADSDRVTEGVA